MYNNNRVTIGYTFDALIKGMRDFHPETNLFYEHLQVVLHEKIKDRTLLLLNGVDIKSFFTQYEGLLDIYNHDIYNYDIYILNTYTNLTSYHEE